MNEKKQYVKPLAEIVQFEVKNVVLASGSGMPGNPGNPGIPGGPGGSGGPSIPGGGGGNA